MKAPSFRLVLILLAAASTPSFADFSGAYTLNPPVNGERLFGPNTTQAFGNWTFNLSQSGFGTAKFTTNAPSSMTLDTGSPVMGGLQWFSDMKISVVIPEGGLLSFSYTIATGNTTFDRASYLVDGVRTLLPVGGSGTTAGSVSGTISNILVEDGDILTFLAHAGPKSLPGGIQSYTRFTIQDFSIVAVPEPSTAFFGMLAVGALGLRRRRQTS